MRRSLFALLVAVLLLAFIPLTFSENGPVTVFAPNEWCHVSVAGTPVESVGWTKFGDDVQITFFAFNQSDLSYDQFVVVANKSFSDPLDKFDVSWNGEITVEEKIVLSFSSLYGPVSTVIEPFTGEIPHWGRPSMNHIKTVITTQARIYDIVVEETHVASFEWSMITLSTNETDGGNQTVPQLVVYNPDGTKFDMRALTASFVPIIEYYDIVGWMMDFMGSNYVKWIIYGGEPFQIRTSQGFGSMDLPFFIVYPKSLTVHPGETVTIQFRLPDGVTSYEATWNDPYYSKYIVMDSDPSFNSQTNQYEATFKFSDSAENRRFPIRVVADKYGVAYEGTASVTVLAPLWKVIIVPLVAFIVVIVGLALFLRYLVRARKVPPDASHALRSDLL